MAEPKTKKVKISDNIKKNIPNTIKVKGSKNITDTPITTKSADTENFSNNENDLVYSKSKDNKNINELNKITELVSDRNDRYKMYDEMRYNDCLVSAALEIYADEIAQTDTSGKIVSVSAEDQEVSDEVNRLLDLLKIDSKLWDIAYSVVLYGDVYLKVFRKETTRSSKKSDFVYESNKIESVVMIEPPKAFTLENYFEKESDPARIYDIQSRGNTVGYCVGYPINKENFTQYNSIEGWIYTQKKKDIEVLDSHSYVHIFLPDSGNRCPYLLHLDDGSNKDDSVREYQILTGKSLLQDVYKTSQQLQLIENSIILARLSKSSVYRIVHVDTGNKSRTEKQKIVQEVRGFFDKKTLINTNTGSYNTYNSPSGEVSTIVASKTPAGGNSISVEDIKSDYDLKSIADLDYSINKELGALTIPKQYLNFTDGAGFDGGASLDKIGAQFTHRIVRYKVAILEGLTKLINLFLEVSHPTWINKFKLKMVSATIQDDNTRLDLIKTKLDVLNNIKPYIDLIENKADQLKIIKSILTDAIVNNDLSEALQNQINKIEQDENTNNTENNTDMNNNTENNTEMNNNADMTGSDLNTETPTSIDDFIASI